MTFFNTVKTNLDLTLPLYLKPANHLQEATVAKIDPAVLPRLYNHELFATKDFVALNAGETKGRLRVFADLDLYKANAASIQWYDIIMMDRVPDDIKYVQEYRDEFNAAKAAS